MRATFLHTAILLSLVGGVQAQERVPVPAPPTTPAPPAKTATPAPASQPTPSPQRPRTIRGEVVDAAGKGISGVGVAFGWKDHMVTADCRTQPLATTDGAGKFSFELAPPKEEEEEAQRRTFLLFHGAGWIAAQVKTPAVDHGLIRSFKRPETPMEHAARHGLELLARAWGRAVEVPDGSVTVAKVILRPGTALTGRVVDAAGQPVAGAKLTGKDLLTSGRFSGMPSMGKKTIYATHAVSGADGSFSLPGVFTTGTSLRVALEGYVTVVQPVTEASVEVHLAKAEKLKGRVLAGGKPATAQIKVLYELASKTTTVAVDKEGTFEIQLEYGPRYRVSVTPSGEAAKTHQLTYSPVLDGPSEDLVIELTEKKAAPKKKPKRPTRVSRFARVAKAGFPVIVVDKTTQRPVADFQAAAIWVRPNYNVNRDYFLNRSAGGTKASQPGYVRVPGPTSESSRRGAVVIRAKGYAPFVSDEIEWETNRPPRIRAELEPESMITGRVVDGPSGKPIPGARVQCYRYYGNGSTHQTSRNTDKDGCFRWESLSAGPYRLYVSYKGRRARSIHLELIAEDKQDFTIELAGGMDVSGRILGVEGREGWKVMLLSENNARSVLANPAYRGSGRSTELREGGYFEFVGVDEGYYEICLRIPQDARQGSPLTIALEPIRVRKRSVHVEVDATPDLPARIRGKIGMKGVQIPMSRLLVIARTYAPPTPYYYYYNSNVDVTGSRSEVAADGSFSALVAPGKQQIKVIDVLTGVQLYRSPSPVVVKGGRDVKVAVKLELTNLRVHIKPAKEGGRVAAQWLDLDVEEPRPEAMRMFAFFSGRNSRGPAGLSLVGRTGPVDLVLPPHKTRLQVMSQVSRLARTKQKPSNTVGDAEITPKPGEQNEITIEVDIPVTGFDPEPDADEEKKVEVAPEVREVQVLPIGRKKP